MAEIDFLSMAFNGLMGFGFIAFIGLIILGALAAGYLSGVFKKRRFRSIIFEKRAGFIEPFIGTGDFLKGKNGGQWENFYGAFNSQKCNAPELSNIHPGNVVVGVARSKNDVHWLGPEQVEIDDTNIKMKPQYDNGMVTTTFDSLVEEADRFSEKDKWMQLVPWVALVVTAVIIILPTSLGMGELAKSLNANAAALTNQNTMIANILENSTIIHEVQPSSTPTTPNPLKPLG